MKQPICWLLLLGNAAVGMCAGRFFAQPVYALSSSEATAVFHTTTTNIPVGETATVSVRVSASEDIPMRGAQFSVLVPSTVNVTNLQSHIDLGDNDMYEALARKEGRVNTFVPLKIAQYVEASGSLAGTYHDMQVTMLTVTPHIIPTANGPFDLFSFDVSPTVEGPFTIRFRTSPFSDAVPQTVASDTINFLSTPLTSVSFSTEGGSTTCTKQGDVDCSGIVDLQDLSIVLSHFGKLGGRIQGDVSGDGTVNLTDLAQVLAQFGS